MRKFVLTIGMLGSLFSAAVAQRSGNQVYNPPQSQTKTNTGVLDSGNENQYSIEASVLINAKADSYVAVFGVQEENQTPEQNNTKLTAQINAFTAELGKLGISRSDIYVDFITQNRVYDFTISGNTARESFSGFETKKTIAVKFKNDELFEPVVAAAAKLKIFDLIKVDYFVSDSDKFRQKLFEEAVKVIREKESKYKDSFGVKLAPAGLAREQYDTHYPASRYKRYQAYETGGARTNYNTGNQILERKSFTFYYEPLDPNDFDRSINDIGIEPIVQFTLYLRMDYDTERITKEK
ncbi:MAG: SIMPL domain-containing protein [Pyrinomonadaceae bacterium]